MKRRYHLLLPFWIYALFTMLVAGAAMVTQYNLLFWIFGAMSAALLTSGIISGLMMMRLRVRRVLPDHGVAGQPLVVTYAARNVSRIIPAFNIHFEERAPRGAAARDRAAWNHVMAPASAWIMHIGPQELVHGEAILLPTVRGEVHFDRIRMWTTFPFGIIKKSITFNQSHRLLIHPRIFSLRRSVLRAIVPGGTIGMKVAQHAGAGDDYFGLREHREGDSMRHIAWKRTANRDELVTIERTRPNPPRLRVILNLSPAWDAGGHQDTAATRHRGRKASRHRGSKAARHQGGGERELDASMPHASLPSVARELEERAISLCASIIHAADHAGYEVGLTILGIDREPIPVRRSHWHCVKMHAALAELDLEMPRVAPKRRSQTEVEIAGRIVIHPDRVDTSVVRGEAWHFTARQMNHLVDDWPPEGARRDVTDPAEMLAKPGEGGIAA